MYNTHACHRHICKQAHTQIHVYTCTYVYTRLSSHMGTQAQTCTHLNAHVYMHTHGHMLIYTCMHTHTHIDTQFLSTEEDEDTVTLEGGSQHPVTSWRTGPAPAPSAQTARFSKVLSLPPLPFGGNFITDGDFQR